MRMLTGIWEAGDFVSALFACCVIRSGIHEIGFWIRSLLRPRLRLPDLQHSGFWTEVHLPCGQAGRMLDARFDSDRRSLKMPLNRAVCDRPATQEYDGEGDRHAHQSCAMLAKADLNWQSDSLRLSAWSGRSFR
jgi:hypothetical protein